MTHTQQMTIPLWGLVVFVGWTIAIVVFLLVIRIQHLSTGGSPKNFGTPNDESLLWRLFRVQSNLVENLPLYLGVVFLLTVRGISGTTIDSLAVTYIVFRLMHSLIHIAGINPNFRVLCLAMQCSCLIALTILSTF